MMKTVLKRKTPGLCRATGVFLKVIMTMTV